MTFVFPVQPLKHVRREPIFNLESVMVLEPVTMHVRPAQHLVTALLVTTTTAAAVTVPLSLTQLVWLAVSKEIAPMGTTLTTQYAMVLVLRTHVFHVRLSDIVPLVLIMTLTSVTALHHPITVA